MNIAQNQLAQCAAPQNEIPSEMENLTQALSALAEYIGRLACRIEPILKDQPSAMAERQPMPPIASKVGGELRALTQNVNGLIDTVDGLSSRVAL